MLTFIFSSRAPTHLCLSSRSARNAERETRNPPFEINEEKKEMKRGQGTASRRTRRRMSTVPTPSPKMGVRSLALSDVGSSPLAAIPGSASNSPEVTTRSLAFSKSGDSTPKKLTPRQRARSMKRIAAHNEAAAIKAEEARKVGCFRCALQSMSNRCPRSGSASSTLLYVRVHVLSLSSSR